MQIKTPCCKLYLQQGAEKQIEQLSVSFIRTLTVGNGIAPFQPQKRFADFTAGEELHLALKYFI